MTIDELKEIRSRVQRLDYDIDLDADGMDLVHFHLDKVLSRIDDSIYELTYGVSDETV